MTIGQFIDDIELRLYQGKPSDDKEIPREQIKFVLGQVNAAFVNQWLQKNGYNVPGGIVTRFQCVAIATTPSECFGGCVTSHYIELPTVDGKTLSILTLPNDAGVVQVLHGNKPIYRLLNPSQLRIDTRMRFAKADSYFSRVGDKIYLFNGIFPSYAKFDVYAVCLDLSYFTENDKLPTIEGLLPQITEGVIEILSKELGSGDIADDGTQN